MSSLRSSPNEIEAVLFSKMERLRATNCGVRRRRRLPFALEARYLRGHLTGIHPDTYAHSAGHSFLCLGVAPSRRRRNPLPAYVVANTKDDRDTQAIMRSVFIHGKRIGLKQGARRFPAMHRMQEIGGRGGIQSGFREKPCEEVMKRSKLHGRILSFVGAVIARFAVGASASRTVSFTTFLAGSNQDVARAVAIDSAGNTYMTGLTASSNFPLILASMSKFPVQINSRRCGAHAMLF